MRPDIISTGFGDAERAGFRIRDTVSGFAQGQIGPCSVAGAKLSGATVVIGVDSLRNRLQVARRRGAHHAIKSSRIDPVDEINTLRPGGEERMRRLNLGDSVGPRGPEPDGHAPFRARSHREGL